MSQYEHLLSLSPREIRVHSSDYVFDNEVFWEDKVGRDYNLKKKPSLLSWREFYFDLGEGYQVIALPYQIYVQSSDFRNSKPQKQPYLSQREMEEIEDSLEQYFENYVFDSDVKTDSDTGQLLLLVRTEAMKAALDVPHTGKASYLRRLYFPLQRPYRQVYLDWDSYKEIS